MRTILLAVITTTALATVAGVAGAQPTSPPPPDDGFGDDVGAPTTDAGAAAREVPYIDRAYIALGGARALSDVQGIAGVFRMTDSLDLDAIVGLARFSGGGGTTSALGVTVGVRQLLAERGSVALSVGGRVGVAYTGSSVMGGARTRWLLEAPARIELAATPWLRLHVEGGLAIGIEPGTDSIEGPTEGATSWSLGAAGLAAGAGFSIALR
jgi:hypothetical protein